MLDKNLLNRKLKLLSEYVDQLEPLVGGDITDIKNDRVLTAAIERYFQLVVDLMIDVNVHVIREGNFGAPDDLQDTFNMIGSHQVIDSAFAEKIAPIVGARNMLVHRYEKLDKDLFLRNLKKNFPDFKRYISEIFAFVEKYSPPPKS